MGAIEAGQRSNEVVGNINPALAQAHRMRDPGYQAYMLLRSAFVVAPILFGLDKFFNQMTFWPKYLWVGFPNALSVHPQTFMRGVGVVEIAAGLGVLFIPRVAAYVVAAWLAGIITNLVILSIVSPIRYWDIALRDFGLLLGALALARLASVLSHPSFAPDVPELARAL